MAKRKYTSSRRASQDDPEVFVLRRDYAGGTNNRQHPSTIGDSQGKNLQNLDISIPGQTPRRPGQTLVEDLGAGSINSMFNYDPQGGSPNLLVTETTNLKRWSGSGSFSAAIKNNFTTGLFTKIIKAYKSGVGDVALLGNGTDNWFEMTPSYSMNDLGSTAGTGSDSPPKSQVATAYRNRVWILKSDLLYFSDASPSDYSTAFDTVSQVYRIPVGEERSLFGSRDLGLIVGGKEQIWALNPSVTPAATDKPEKLLDIGIAAGETFQQVGDDYLFLSFDGVRGLKRTIQDKLQLGQSYPISYPLKTEFDEINWQYITKACAVYWDNKYFISLPTGASTYNNKVWVYFPATNSWTIITGWNVASWAKFKVNNEERLYAGEASANGLVYRAWSGASDNGTAVDMVLEGRNEDLGYPAVKKVGGEVKVTAKPSGNYNLTVSASFDNGAFNTLGVLNLATSLITFPVTYPVTFSPDAVSYKKFHLDSYGPWYSVRLKLSHNAVTTNSDDITIYEVFLASMLEEYISEEEV